MSHFQTFIITRRPHLSSTWNLWFCAYRICNTPAIGASKRKAVCPNVGNIMCIGLIQAIFVLLINLTAHFLQRVWIIFWFNSNISFSAIWLTLEHWTNNIISDDVYLMKYFLSCDIVTVDWVCIIDLLFCICCGLFWSKKWAISLFTKYDPLVLLYS